MKAMKAQPGNDAAKLKKFFFGLGAQRPVRAASCGQVQLSQLSAHKPGTMSRYIQKTYHTIMEK
jgi:hypothetical protein